MTWAVSSCSRFNYIDPEGAKEPSGHSDMAVQADVKDLREQLELVLDEEYGAGQPVFTGGTGLKDRTWTETCRMWKEKYPVVLPKDFDHGEDEDANVYAFLKEMSNRLNEDQVIVVGNGSACVVGGHACIIKKGQRFISNSAIASMGYDLPAAIGACLAVLEGHVQENGAQEGHIPHTVTQLTTSEFIMVTGDGSF